MNSTTSKKRSSNYIRQIKGSFFFKGLAVLFSFITVPLMIRYLGKEGYGVWATVLSIMSWIVFFDVGLGNGLRNKISESLAKNKTDSAKNYISSAYTFIGFISLFIFMSLLVISFFIPWNLVFNTNTINEGTLKQVIIISSLFICLNFWISLINQVFNALQRTSLVVFGQFLSNTIAFFLILFLVKYTEASLIYLSIVYGCSLILSNIILSFWFYCKRNDLLPVFSLQREYLKPLLSLGVQFFLIQIAVLVIFTTDKILIAQFFGPSFVTEYDIVYKIFALISLAHSLILAPLWPSYSDAYHRGDFKWIRNSLRKQLYIYALLSFSVIILALSSRSLIEIWIGKEIFVSKPLIYSMALFVLISTWNNVFGCLLGGINKIRLGSIYTIFTAAINIPISYILAVKCSFGVTGIVYGTTISISISAILSPLQVYYFIYTKNSSALLSKVLK
ncbi:oligosaccharide flippase family protein [Endozoicomonas atrinae]|uniref:oligosaccharide flippase family protein n=1 Tax=Endozoicomonas atrinae TaxID=1333660 RepID=UPI003B008CAE